MRKYMYRQYVLAIVNFLAHTLSTMQPHPQCGQPRKTITMPFGENHYTTRLHNAVESKRSTGPIPETLDSVHWYNSYFQALKLVKPLEHAKL